MLNLLGTAVTIPSDLDPVTLFNTVLTDNKALLIGLIGIAVGGAILGIIGRVIIRTPKKVVR